MDLRLEPDYEPDENSYIKRPVRFFNKLVLEMTKLALEMTKKEDKKPSPEERLENNPAPSPQLGNFAIGLGSTMLTLLTLGGSGDETPGMNIEPEPAPKQAPKPSPKGSRNNLTLIHGQKPQPAAAQQPRPQPNTARLKPAAPTPNFFRSAGINPEALAQLKALERLMNDKKHREEEEVLPNIIPFGGPGGR